MQTVQVDGRRVFVGRSEAAVGEEQPPAMLIHGAGLTHAAWAGPRRGLARNGRTVLAIDLPGHGRSAGPPLTTIAALADWIVRLLDALAVERVGLAGHSLGALVALDVAARYPARVSGLALVGAALQMPVHPALLQAARDDLPAAVAMICRWGQGDRRGSDPTGAKKAGGAIERIMQRTKPGVLAAGLAACDAYSDASERAAAVRCPTVMLAGESDRMTPAKGGADLAAAITGASFVVVPGGGHMLPIDNPRETVEALLRVL